RSGYYRDQTFMFASGMMKTEEFFAQLYGDTELANNPANGGRLMNNHFATRSLDQHGNWKNLVTQKNSSADISPTAGQMPRLLGLAQASKLYRQVPEMKKYKKFSVKGNEIAFGTIGDASTSEGHFFETINAAGVLQVPLLLSVWDDGYGISVPKVHQTTKQSISLLLKGFEKESQNEGFIIKQVKGWDYAELITTYREVAGLVREHHIPAVIHVTELTQPQGHSTSGSHERYKDEKRLLWEKEHDGITRFKQWILSTGVAKEEVLTRIEEEALQAVKQAKKSAWNSFSKPIIKKRDDFLAMVDITTCNCAKTSKIEAIKTDLKKIATPIRSDITSAGKKIVRLICDACSDPENSLKERVNDFLDIDLMDNENRYSTHLYSRSDRSYAHIEPVEAIYKEKPEYVPGREILRDNFDHIFRNNDNVVIFGEDVGKIGGVNQSLEGLQEKYGVMRVADTGIREATIIGQGIGLAMRGLRPIAEIQYFDYLLYGLQVLSDDLATLHYRTRGGQKAPLIISTRGHRLEGIWHSGSPLSMVVNSLRGVHVLVPRNMTKAAGFYNTMLATDEPALIIEPLNGYRLREPKPENIGEFKVPIGKAEVLIQGEDVTVVTYGSCVRIAENAVKQLSAYDISAELIDVQSLLPFDLDHAIAKSIQKTNKVIFFDEDVPGGATSYMMQKVLEEQHGWSSLDAAPRTLTAKEHRAAYSSDGDYYSNPNAEDLFDIVYNMMHEYHPQKFPKTFSYKMNKNKF
ncbi:MAG: thiamine pyrophosphate-dependent enzyme, partial [Bacteroidales bacterium]|nr:thiamine pyrophosphate-dependent enzyme [Bacteroidales bacterium]